MIKKLKKYCTILIAVTLVLCFPLQAFAGGGDIVAVDQSFDEEIQATSAGPAEIKAKSAVLMEANSGQIFFENNSHEQMPPASITKIMTLLLVMEAIDNGKISLEDTPICSEHANSMGGSQIWLEVGEKMSVDDLLKAVCVVSANDASVMLAEHVAGSEDSFVELMNKRASELGMNDTVFKNVSGLDEDGHITSAYDIAIMSRELLKHDLITNYSTIWMDSLRNGETSLVNTNRLVRFYEGTTGLKTGTTDKAGKCLSASANRNGLNLIAVVLGSDTSDDRFNSAKTLLDYGFANWEVGDIPQIQDDITPVPVLHGVEEYVNIDQNPMESVVVQKGRKDDIQYNVELADDVEAPVEEGQILGKVSLTLDGEEIASYTLKASQSIEKMTFGKAFVSFAKSLLNFS